MLPDIDLSLTEDAGRLWVVGLLLLLGFLLAFRSYLARGSASTLPNRGLLFLLRGLSLLLIAFALFGPVLRVCRTRAVKPAYSVLIDRSLSMDLPIRYASGEGESRIERAEEHLRREHLIDLLASRADLRFFAFSDHAIPVEADSIFALPGGLVPGRTDIVTAIREARDLDPDADGLIIITDGRINRGEDLRGYAGVDRPILFLGVGRDSGSPDIDLEGIETPTRIVEDSPFSMTVTLRVRAERSDTVTLTLSEGDHAINSVEVAVEAGEYRREVTLSAKEIPAGRHVFQARVEAMADEPFIGNNCRHRVVNVLASGKSALLLSTTPRWDLSFLIRALRGLDYLDVDLFLLPAGSGRGVYTSGRDEIVERRSISELEINRYDLLCLQGDVSDQRLSGLSEPMRTFQAPRKGIVFLVTEGIEGTPPAGSPFLGLLPFPAHSSLDIESGRYDLLPPIAGGTESPLPLPDLGPVLSSWSTLPPITGRMKGSSVTSGRETRPVALLSVRGEGERRVPVVLVEDRRGFRIVSLVGRGFWRWSFNRSLSGEMGSFYRRFVDSLVRWASSGLDAGTFHVIPIRPSYPRGEPIEFRVEGEVGGEELLVTMESLGGKAVPNTFSFRLKEGEGEGNIITIFPPPPGDYRYSYRLRGRETEGHGFVYVDSYSREFSRPQPDDLLLGEVKRSVAGEYVDLFKVTRENVGIYAPIKKIEKVDMSTIVINSHPLFFIVILILLIVEIFLRKSAGFS